MKADVMASSGPWLVHSKLTEYGATTIFLSATTIHTSFTGSRLISEVNLVLAGLVLGWETTWE